MHFLTKSTQLWNGLTETEILTLKAINMSPCQKQKPTQNGLKNSLHISDALLEYLSLLTHLGEYTIIQKNLNAPNCITQFLAQQVQGHTSSFPFQENKPVTSCTLPLISRQWKLPVCSFMSSDIQRARPQKICLRCFMPYVLKNTRRIRVHRPRMKPSGGCQSLCFGF